MIRPILAAALLSVFMLINQSFALDLTVGDTSCSEWLKVRQDLRSWARSGQGAMPNATGMESWVLGYVTGYGDGCDNKDLAKGLDSDGIFEKLDAICAKTDASTPLFLAARDLVVNLDPKHREFCLH